MTKLTDERADGGKWTLKMKEMEGPFDSCAGFIPDIAEEIWEKNQKQVCEGSEPVAPIICFDSSKVGLSDF